METIKQEVEQIVQNTRSMWRDNVRQCEKCGQFFTDAAENCPGCGRAQLEIEKLRKSPEKALEYPLGIGKRYLQCSFENFTGGKQYVDACREWAENPSGSMYVFGSPGCGKTHLAVSMARSLIQKGATREYPEDLRWEYTIELLNKLRRSFQTNDSPDSLIDGFSRTKILFLDDLGSERATEWAVEALTLIIDRRDREEKPIVVTSNLSLSELSEHLSPRVASRLSNGKIINVKLPDYRTKRKASST